MAVTKIKQINQTVNKALRYIMKPDKTVTSNGCNLISTYGCEAESAEKEFNMTRKMAEFMIGNRGNKKTLAYHVMQSFSPEDDVTPELAHKLGVELADRLLKGKFEYVVTTHIDKDHIHNHIIFNATSCEDYKKFRCKPYATAREIRTISDVICAENNLSIVNPKDRGTVYKEDMERKKNNSWKSDIRKRINLAIQVSRNFSDFILQMEELGIHIEEKEGKKGKYLVFECVVDGEIKRISDVRLSDNDAFSKEGIENKISEFNEDKKQISTAVEEAISCSKSIEEFKKKVEEFGVDIRVRKDGMMRYKISGEEGMFINDVILGSEFTENGIKARIHNLNMTELEKKLSIANEYGLEKEIKNKKVDEKEVLIKNEDIIKTTADGILINISSEDGIKNQLFIDKGHMKYNHNTDDFSIYISPDYNYYFTSERLDPDKLESDQIGSISVKGSQIINGSYKNIAPRLVAIDRARIIGMNTKGVTLETDMGRVHFDDKYVVYNRTEQTCYIKMYDEWSYCISQKNIKDKIEYRNVDGFNLRQELESGDKIVEQSELSRRINYVARMRKKERVHDLAGKVRVVNENNLRDKTDFDNKITSIKNELNEIRSNIDQLEAKRTYNNNILKFLVSYRENRPIKLEHDSIKSKISRKLFYTHHKKEMEVYELAEKKLKELKIEPEKIDVETIKSNIQDIVKELKEEKVLERDRQASLQRIVETQNEIERLRNRNTPELN